MFKYMPIRSFFDRQSQLANRVAPKLPGAAASDVEEYAEPLYHVPRHAAIRHTGKFNKPLAVVRCKVAAPVLDLDLGTLEAGMYAVRVIGAVETNRIRPFRRPLYVAMSVNDRVDGSESTHRIACGYCDEFYSVAELYFHAPVRRRYRAKVWVDKGSEVDLLVRNVCLDDALAGTVRRAIKKRSTLGSPVKVTEPSGMSKQERLARDAAIWNSFPPVNAQGAGQGYSRARPHINFPSQVSFGVGGEDMKEAESKYGRWSSGGRDALLVNKKLGMKYTFEDLRNNRPLPDPYPFKDDGAGLYYVDPANPGAGKAFCPIAREVGGRIARWPGRFGARDGDEDRIRDASVALAAWSYGFPSIDPARYIASICRAPGSHGRSYANRRRMTTAMHLRHYANYVSVLYPYDRLYGYISTSQELADSIRRFVPWVRTPRDVVKLIDVYFVQTTAKRIMRYHYHTDPMEIANVASMLGDRDVTDPWLEWLFSRTFIYPLPPAGIQDVMITGCSRDGQEYVGSTYYSQGESAARVAAALERYRAAGGNPRYDLSDFARYPKPVAHLRWRVENVVGGWDFLRVGDVTGPDKRPGHTLRSLGWASAGWKWTKDPRFAFILKHYGRSSSVEVANAAGKLRRAPWLDNRSRVMPAWAAVLETGHQHDDPRFRRAVYCRVGYGYGHHHDDTLDMQVVAHGLPMTIDGGQRPGYSSPPDRKSRVHNTVEVDGSSYHGHSWARAMADGDGARYMHLAAPGPGAAKSFARQVALIDVDEGKGSKPLPISRQKPGSALPKGVTTGNSYVFDVFRVGGGSRHTYCFHGPLHDDFQWNATAVAPPAAGSDE
ncbi:MAG: hypothetical protein ACYS5V_11895, partial [Planctomycetota bacterium]